MLKSRPLTSTQQRTDDFHSSNPLQTLSPPPPFAGSDLPDIAHVHKHQNPVSTPKRGTKWGQGSREERKDPKVHIGHGCRSNGVRGQYSQLQAGREKTGPGPFPRGTWDEVHCPRHGALSQIPPGQEYSISPPCPAIGAMLPHT